jgi:lipopolysaccharide/colanic/teichoic acid biosynthesis glycosyltransferase
MVKTEKNDLMPVWKRLFDLCLGALVLVVFSPFLLAVVVCMLLYCGMPVFHVSERMKTPDRAFRLIKFRTMRSPRQGEVDTGVSGGDKTDRITPLGRHLRSARLDELPQLLNILSGDMSFVGPRPPLRQYTNMFPDLYAAVLVTPPGVTGLASIIFHKAEARLLASSRSAQETEAIYITRCIPRKARLDQIYIKNRSLRLDLYILYLTAAKIVPLPGRRARRVR